MERIKNCVLVDFMSIWNKKMIVLFALLFFIYMSSNMGAAFFIIPLIFAFYPFRNDEHNISALYFAPVTKADIVKGRYIFSLFLLLCIMAVSSAVSFAFSVGLETGINLINLHELVFLIVFYLISLALLMPLFFKFGYSKGQYALYLLVLFFAFLAGILRRIPVIDKILLLIENLQLGIGSLVLLISAGCLFVASAFVSKDIYRKRNL